MTNQRKYDKSRKIWQTEERKTRRRTDDAIEKE